MCKKNIVAFNESFHVIIISIKLSICQQNLQVVNKCVYFYLPDIFCFFYETCVPTYVHKIRHSKQKYYINLLKGNSNKCRNEQCGGGMLQVSNVWTTELKFIVLSMMVQCSGIYVNIIYKLLCTHK